jgi:hypothetical protein
MAEPKNKSRADKAVDNVKKKDAPKSSTKNSKKTDKKSLCNDFIANPFFGKMVGFKAL